MAVILGGRGFMDVDQRKMTSENIPDRRWSVLMQGVGLLVYSLLIFPFVLATASFPSRM